MSLWWKKGFFTRAVHIPKQSWMIHWLLYTPHHLIKGLAKKSHKSHNKRIALSTAVFSTVVISQSSLGSFSIETVSWPGNRIENDTVSKSLHGTYPTVYVRAISFSGVGNIFKELPLTSYRKGKSLKDTLVRARIMYLRTAGVVQARQHFF